MRALSWQIRTVALLAFLGCSAFDSVAFAGIHRAPIVVPGFKIRPVTRYPISTYRIFKTGPKGEAITIPFQIDEINQWGDYVLDQGSEITKNTGNGIFDLQDELAIMGDDVGPAVTPTSWPQGKPTLVYELRFDYMGEGAAKPGAVYIGVYFRKPPEAFQGKYVIFNPTSGKVTSSRYNYVFDPRNHLVVNGVDMLRKSQTNSEPVRLLDSSTFYMKADLKYFITVKANHRSIDSSIEAYKTGPIRSIVRVSFFYKFLSLKFELGMYTEVSFFSNSVVLPAIMYNPINGPKSLNKGSSFYYGFALKDSPADYILKTNMRMYEAEKTGLLSGLLGGDKKQPAPEPFYWISVRKPDRMMYVEIVPSKEMIKVDNIPTLYVENKSSTDMASRPNDDPEELGKSPVNLGLNFDLTKFTEGEHTLSIKLYFENYYSETELDSFRKLNLWDVATGRVR